jgi:hypothetical protein
MKKLKIFSLSQRRKERKGEMCFLLQEIISLHDYPFAGLAPLREKYLKPLNQAGFHHVKTDRNCQIKP